MIAQTVSELTNYEYNELCYNSIFSPVTGEYVYQICELLNKCKIKIKSTTVYDKSVSDAVSQFQEKMGMNVTGNVNNATLQALILQADKMNDIISDDGETIDDSAEEGSESPHYNSFFNDDKYKTHRKNHKDIKIVFGNNSISKTIKNVIMMSVSVEVDTSGNPISEVYEFIAQDIVESDELSDSGQYIENQEESSSIVSYNFPNIN